MPVTAKLSRKFYERLGDDVANELVDWFNAVDETYRAQLKELNDLNWNRFEGSMDARFAEFELLMDKRFSALELKLEQRFAAVDAKMEQRFAAVDARLERGFASQARWMVGLWLGTVLPLGALMVGLFNTIR
jgi:hypothetical protein